MTPPPLQPRPPRWIDRLLLVSAALAGVAVLAALWAGYRSDPSRGKGYVVDRTVNLNGRPVREHCVTCHASGGRPPDEPHPDIRPHSIEELGCTGCHLGEGMALDTEISHGLPGLGARRVLVGEELQASCYRCHLLEPLEGAERAWAGHGLFRAEACGTCHRVNPAERGGRYGPDLRAVGSHLGLARLREAVREPRKEPPGSSMPRFPLSSRQVEDLAIFLKSRVEDPAHLTPMVRRALARRARRVPEISPEAPLRDAACLACHRFREEGAWIGPDLTFLGRMREREYLRTFLREPTRLVPGAMMPRIALGVPGEERVVAFLFREGTGPLPARTPKRLYMTLCQPCHAANGDGHGVLQPNLANFPRAFAGNAAFFRWVPDERLERSLRSGIPGTSMPPYGELLSAGERDGLLAVVFRFFVRAARGDKAPVPPLPPRPAVPPGPETVTRAYAEHCTRCHGRAGTGKGPEYLSYLPRPRDLTNHPYFASVSDDRIARAIRGGVPGTAMAGYADRLSPSLLWGLVRRIRELSDSR